MVDDLVLRFQRMVDHVARWARLGRPAPHARRRFLIIQIDGLSEAILDKALKTRRLRHIRRLLRTGRCRGLLQRFFNHTERDRPAWARDDSVPSEAVRIITAGPNAFVYFLGSPEPLAIEAIEPSGAGVHLSTHPGIGLVLARSARGPVCWWRGRQVSLDGDGDDGPFAGRADRALVLKGLRDLMAMPSAGDLVLYGIGARDSNVSFIDERGAHAGPSETEMQTFILHPATVTLPAPLTHPAQLYPHFAAYGEDADAGC